MGGWRQQTGDGKRRKNLLSSGLRSPSSSLPFSVILFLTVSVISLSAVDINKPAVGLTYGITVDIAPFGIEQIYFTTQSSYILPGTIALSIRPSFSLNDSSKMLRIPLVLNVSKYVDKKEFFLLSAYFGGGMEVYRSIAHNTDSLLLTGGFAIVAGSFVIDIPIVRAYRSYNTDSDITLTAGLYFQR